MSFTRESQELFKALADAAFGELRHDEELNLSLDGEDQTYLRFNAAQVRQATQVQQRRLAMAFQCRGRKLDSRFDLSGQYDWDLATLRSLLKRARDEAGALPEDPFLVAMQSHGTSQYHYESELPLDAEVIECVATAAADSDFAGLFASGPQFRAVRNSKGQDHWFSRESFFLDYSLFAPSADGDHHAVKGTYADQTWNTERFLASLNTSREQLSLLQRPSVRVAPGAYRVYLAPAAVAEIIGMFSWGAVSYGAWKKGDCALKRLIEGEASFSERFSLKENFNLGLTPPFNSLGELPPMELPIIENGKLINLLVSSRSAKEYGVISNAAEPEGWIGEPLRSVEVMSGDLDQADILKALGTGLYISNLHYLNWSDVQTARITGMTRYACYWVENGEIASPIQNLRFDESLYRIFGSELERLTRESHIDPATDTYDRRSLGGRKNPGALIGAFSFTF